MYVCLCRALTERDVARAARGGATTGPVLIATLGLDDPRCCGRCARDIDRFVALAAATVARSEVPPMMRSEPSPIMRSEAAPVS